MAAHDPRPSIAERYGTSEGYVCVVRAAAERAVTERFLLRDDADRLIAEAASSGVLPSGAVSGEDSRVVASTVCGPARR